MADWFDGFDAFILLWSGSGLAVLLRSEADLVQRPHALKIGEMKTRAMKTFMHTNRVTCFCLVLGLIALVAAGQSGCTDGPFYHMKKANPYFQKQWKKDRELGPIFVDRLEELELLKGQLASMSAGEQEQWAAQLAAIVQKDPSSEMRARAVNTIAKIQSDTAVTSLNFASRDEVEKVRMAACKAWKLRGDNAAREMLLSLAQADESTSVRQAAVDGLSVFKEDGEVRTALTNLLSDRSPAVQFQVAQSLKSMTGRDYGGDFDAWKRFMAGENVPEPPPLSTAERVWNALPSF